MMIIMNDDFVIRDNKGDFFLTFSNYLKFMSLIVCYCRLSLILLMLAKLPSFFFQEHNTRIMN